MKPHIGLEVSSGIVKIMMPLCLWPVLLHTGSKEITSLHWHGEECGGRLPFLGHCMRLAAVLGTHSFSFIFTGVLQVLAFPIFIDEEAEDKTRSASHRSLWSLSPLPNVMLSF